ncbi:hypothetical protein BT93_D0319 [Corymbia citriodora subsp. variegata]|nr:hypothetical protein BT93_D0319 [Corymbia citriodora subsp. variegata]
MTSLSQSVEATHFELHCPSIGTHSFISKGLKRPPSLHLLADAEALLRRSPVPCHDGTTPRPEPTRPDPCHLCCRRRISGLCNWFQVAPYVIQ